MEENNKDLLKKVLVSGGKGAALGTGLGFLANSNKDMLKSIGNRANPMFKGNVGPGNKKAFNQTMEGIDGKYLPAVTGLGLGSYTAGSTLVKELLKRNRSSNKEE